jgi:hypothetical protein
MALIESMMVHLSKAILLVEHILNIILRSRKNKRPHEKNSAYKFQSTYFLILSIITSREGSDEFEMF